MPQNRIPLKSYHYRPQGRRTIGRPKKRWREQLWLWRRNGSKGPIVDVYDDDDDDLSVSETCVTVARTFGNTVGVRLMGWQTSACNSSNMPHRPSQQASSTLLSALPPAARCRYCPSLFRTDDMPAYWPSFGMDESSDITAAKIFSHLSSSGSQHREFRHFSDVCSNF